jgi:hypothetical protein
MAGLLKLDRRSFLRGTGVAMALPMLECMQTKASAAEKNSKHTKRMFCLGHDFGLYPNEFFPKESGMNYKMPQLLQPLAKHRKNMTVFSGLDHTGVNGGHKAVCSYLTAVDTKGFSGSEFKNTISIDQLAAEKFGLTTRFPSIQLACGGNSGGMCWTRQGITMHPLVQANNFFDALFRDTSAAEKKTYKENLSTDKSVLDIIMADAKDLNRKLGKHDKEKMAEYFNSVREVEKNLQINKAWIDKPKPRTSAKPPDAVNPYDIFESSPLMYDLIALAFQTNSTRYISLHMTTQGKRINLDGVKEGYHALSHHGKSPDKIKQLIIIERQHSIEFAKFLDKLASIKELGKPLLDDAICLYGGGMGNASSHSNRNLPILLAGGGFKHKGHLAFNKDRSKKPVPLGNLYVTMLQKLGIEVDTFGISTGSISGFS